MKKYFIFLILALVLSACTQKEVDADYLFINETRVKLIGVADTPEKSYRGLSFRESLCFDCGMLFKFNNKTEKTFVMRNMNFPLDIIWIDGNEIKKISKNLPPEGPTPKAIYSSDVPVNYVLEVNGNFTDDNDIKIGDKIIFNQNE